MTLSFLEKFRGSLAGLGDISGDGNVEVPIGSPRDNVEGAQNGLVQILSLEPSGAILGGVEIAQGLGGFTGSLDVGDAFGTSVCEVGDLDGDGLPDLAVGATGGEFSGLGALWILHLAAKERSRAMSSSTNQSLAARAS